MRNLRVIDGGTFAEIYAEWVLFFLRLFCSNLKGRSSIRKGSQFKIVACLRSPLFLAEEELFPRHWNNWGKALNAAKLSPWTWDERPICDAVGLKCWLQKYFWVKKQECISLKKFQRFIESLKWVQISFYTSITPRTALFKRISFPCNLTALHDKRYIFCVNIWYY